MKKIVSFIIICFLLIPANVKAQEEPQWDYEHVSTGDIVPYNGYLFSEDGMINVITKIELKLKQQKIDQDKEKNKLILNYETTVKNKQLEIDTNKTMYSQQLIIKQQAIDSYKNQAYWNNVKLLGGIIGGIACGYLIFSLTSPK